MTPVKRFFELSLLGMLASGYLAVAGSGYLSIPAAVIAACALCLRAMQILGRFEMEIPPAAVTLATAAYIAFFAADYLWLSREFLQATVHLVIFLAVVKLFTAKTTRDFFYLEIIAFLEILAASILSASATFFVALALFLFFTVATFASGEIRRSGSIQQHAVRGVNGVGFRLSALTGSVTLGILLLSSVLFFLLPRTARAAFQHLISERYHIAGFSNEVNLGRIGELKRQQTPIAHIRAFNGSGQMPQMRWRGSALRIFDGHRWSNPPAEHGEQLRPQRGLIQLAEDEQRRKPGRRIAYEVNLQTIASDTIFIAGTPEFLQTSISYVTRMPDDGLKAGFNTQDGLRYGVYSYLDAPIVPPQITTRSRIEHLLLPNVDNRVIELARSLNSPRQIEQYLRKNFAYSLDLPATPPNDPTTYFLFERRAGHCEYFASAMAVMLRAIGVPSRVVTGFSGGVFNDVSGWYVLRAADAHSWVEAWVDGQGWVTFDPTPPDPNAMQFGIRDKLALWVDAFDTFWRDWVLGYSLEQQLNLASRVEQTRFKFTAGDLPLEKIGIVLGVCVVLVVLSLFFPRKWKISWKRRRAIGEGERLYRQMLSVLRQKGCERPAWMTPHEFAGQLPAAPWRDIAVQFTRAYYDFRFGGRPEAANEMRTLLKQL